jgi:hypothetical protein
MKYEIEFSTDVDRQLAQRAAIEGEDVESLIQLAVLQFVSTTRDRGQSSRLRPDAPLFDREFSTPFDLPLSGDSRPIEPTSLVDSSLRPDPVTLLQ